MSTLELLSAPTSSAGTGTDTQGGALLDQVASYLTDVGRLFDEESVTATALWAAHAHGGSCASTLSFVTGQPSGEMPTICRGVRRLLPTEIRRRVRADCYDYLGFARPFYDDDQDLLGHVIMDPVLSIRLGSDPDCRPVPRRLAKEAARLRGDLAEWVPCQAVCSPPELDLPPMPSRVVEDLTMAIWQPLVALADAAGGDWPKRGRNAARSFVSASRAAVLAS